MDRITLFELTATAEWDKETKPSKQGEHNDDDPPSSQLILFLFQGDLHSLQESIALLNT